LSDDATIVRATSWRRTASMSVHVPRTFVSNVDAGDELAVTTSAWAARWKTVSTSYSPSTRSSSASSLTSPSTTVTWRSRSNSASALTGGWSRRRTVTRSPRSSSARTSHAPSRP
jgi:hypothetical protein